MKRDKTTPTVKNIKLHTNYGVCGVEVHLSMQELFQLSLKADILGQMIAKLQDEISDFTLIQLEDLGNFLDNILQSAGFEAKGRAEIFKPIPPTTEEETE